MRRPLLLPLALALTTVLAGKAAGQQPPPPSSTPSLVTTTTLPAPPPGPDTPRGAITRFLEAARTGHYDVATQYLDFRQLPPRERERQGTRLARELGIVLDRALWIDPSQVSADPEGKPNGGLPTLHYSFGTISTRHGAVPIIFERERQPNGVAVWQFAPSTVAAIPDLWVEYGWGPLATVLPVVFFKIRFLNVRLWQWIGLVLLLPGAWIAGTLLAAALAFVARRWEPSSKLFEFVRTPLRLGLAVAVFAAGMPFLALPLPATRFLVGAETALAIVAATWVALRAFDALAERIERQLIRRHALATATVPLGRRVVKVLVAILALVAALQNFGFNVTGILTGLGLGGLAVALAAQKTVENLFGSVSLVADQPVRVGDVCRFGDTVGTVEDIGLRSTRVRTINRTLVTVPNAQFSTLALENLSRRDRIPVRATLRLPIGTAAGEVRRVLSALHQMIVAQPKIDVGSACAHFVGLGTDGLELEIFALVVTSSWDEFVSIREQIFLGAMDVIGGEAANLKRG